MGGGAWPFLFYHFSFAVPFHFFSHLCPIQPFVSHSAICGPFPKFEFFNQIFLVNRKQSGEDMFDSVKAARRPKPLFLDELEVNHPISL